MIEQISGATATTPVTPKSTTAAKSEGPKVAVSVETQPISPRLRFDAAAGVVVTEFLNGKSVASQTPSAAALAYLRVGLNAEGMPKTDDNANEEHTPVEA